MVVCLCITFSRLGINRAYVAPNPVRGQRYRGNQFFLVPVCDFRNSSQNNRFGFFRPASARSFSPYRLKLVLTPLPPMTVFIRTIMHHRVSPQRWRTTERAHLNKAAKVQISWPPHGLINTHSSFPTSLELQ